MAISLGVPASAIVVDPAGVNTDATVRNTVPMLSAEKSGPVAVVSDFFHLPRIKLAYQRAGLDVVTVPSHARRIPQTTRSRHPRDPGVLGVLPPRDPVGRGRSGRSGS